MNRHDNDSSPWTMLSSAIAVLLLARLTIGLAAIVLHSGVLTVLVVLVLLGVAVRIGGTGSRPLGGGWGRLLRGAPRPLGGEARWGALRDLWRAGWIGGTGWPIGVLHALGGLLRVTVRIPDAAQTQSALLLAPVGQGKTDSGIVPIVRSEARIRDEAERHSLIVLDPKGDVLEKARDALEASHTILVWNPSQPEKSTVAFEPLCWVPSDPSDPLFPEACDTAAKAYLAATYGDETGVANSYVADPYWGKQTASILKGLLLYLRALNPRITLLDVARYLAEVTPEEMVRHLTSHPRTEAAALRGTTLRELLYNERARGAVIGELVERFVLLTDPRLTRVMMPGILPAFDLDAFLARPTVLVLQVGALGDVMVPLLSVALSLIQTELVRRTRGGGRLPRGVRIVIDEAGVIGRIHGLDTGIAMMRSADVGYVVAVQATEQLRANYGRDRADIIVRNLTHRLVLGGTTDADAEWVCRNLGKRNAYRDVPGTTARGEETLHYTREEWPLLRPDQLRHLRYRMVVDSSHIPPVLLRLRRYTDGR